MIIYRALSVSAAFVAAVALPGAAMADTNQTITAATNTTSVGGATFGVSNAPGENGSTGSNAVTATRPDTRLGTSDNGSLELHGDRTRFVIGDLFGSQASAGFALSSLQSFTFDWNVDTVTASQIFASPAARVIVADNNGARTELIWEQVYNGGSTEIATTQDQWFNAGANSVWYANIRGPVSFPDASAPLSTFKANSQVNTTGFGIVGANGNGQGVLGDRGSQINQTLSAWTQYFSPSAKVVALSFGAGSGFGAGFTGFVDNAIITTSSGTDRLNFESGVAAVPEPATWAMMLVGFGMVGGTARYRRRRSKILIA